MGGVRGEGGASPGPSVERILRASITDPALGKQIIDNCLRLAIILEGGILPLLGVR